MLRLPRLERLLNRMLLQWSMVGSVWPLYWPGRQGHTHVLASRAVLLADKWPGPAAAIRINTVCTYSDVLRAGAIAKWGAGTFRWQGRTKASEEENEHRGYERRHHGLGRRGKIRRTNLMCPTNWLRLRRRQHQLPGINLSRSRHSDRWAAARPRPFRGAGL